MEPLVEPATRMRALALEIATLERRYRALSRGMDRASARWDREKYEGMKAAQQALGTTEWAVRELADLMRTWGLAFEDLVMLGINSRTVAEVCNTFEGWEIDCSRFGDRLATATR